MDSKRLQAQLIGIRHLLSHLQGEITSIEGSLNQALRVLQSPLTLNEAQQPRDVMNGLVSHNVFLRQIENFFEECRKLNEECGMLLIDIDHLKRVNDTHGHPTGDEVIKRIAQMLKQYESPDCKVARYGGEEFAMAIRGSAAKMLAVAELIRRGAERLHGPVIGPDGQASAVVKWKCTLSVGVACSRSTGYHASRLLNDAQAALLKAKKKGRNQVGAA